MQPDQLDKNLKRMEELRLAFAAKLGEKVKELSRLVLQLDGASPVKEVWNQELLQNIHYLSHTLAGSAGTFKHAAVYEKAKAMEAICNEALHKTEIQPNWHKLLLKLVVGLRGDVPANGSSTPVDDFSSSLVSADQKENSSNDMHTHYPVIVVDDDALLVSLIQEQAQHFEYDVIPLFSALELEAAIEKHQPAAILIDVMFPVTEPSGIEIISQLKAERKINCPVIFISTRSDMTTRLAALRAGSDAYIVKPLDILELIRVLDRLTQKLAKKKSRILIVDDEVLTAKLYETALNGHGFICEIVLNPMEVIQRAANFAPDAILLDINMPGCNGFELAGILRQDDAFCHIPILFLTSVSGQEREVNAINCGGDDFLDKNAGLANLIAIIKGHVNRYRKLDSVLARLKKDEVQFRSVTCSSSDAIITTDEKGRIMFWNEGAENIFGFLALETVGQSLDIILLPEERGKYLESFEEFDKGKTRQFAKHSIERRVVKKDKTEIDIELTYTKWSALNQTFYTAIIRDISDRKQIEQELHHKTAYLDSIIYSSGEAIITTDTKGVIETANPTALSMFGYQGNELIGKNVSILIPETHRDQHDECMQKSKLSSTQTVKQVRELNGVRKDGSIFSVELNVAPMTVAGVQKFVGIMHDVSNRQQILDELLLAKIKAEVASQAKSQFLASMSHELRTPLNAIMGFAQLLQTDTDHPLNAEQRESVTYIYEGGDRLLKLINKVLDLTEMETGSIHLHKVRLELIEMVNELIDQVRPLATQAGLTINNLTDETPIFIESDQVKLAQVIKHLLSNAIQYNKPHGSVNVFLTRMEKRVRLSVADSGKGIPEQLLSELFEPFTRLGEEMGAIEGTGVGLTLTKKLVEMLDGEIGVVSTLGVGTTFWIELNTLD